jgi:hypothetical protein
MKGKGTAAKGGRGRGVRQGRGAPRQGVRGCWQQHVGNGRAAVHGERGGLGVEGLGNDHRGTQRAPGRRAGHESLLVPREERRGKGRMCR